MSQNRTGKSRVPTPNHAEVSSFSIHGDEGLSVGLIDFGAAITSIRVPTNNGDLEVVIACPESQYTNNVNYFGSTVGRYANRIANGQFTLNGAQHELAVNDSSGRHCLHGGTVGFHRRRWTALPGQRRNAIAFSLISPNNDQGFPGELSAQITYSIRSPMALHIDFLATCDRTTVVSLTNHSYLNLDGFHVDCQPSINEHEVLIAADYYTPTDHEGIPTGAIETVASSLLDLREPRVLGELLDSDKPSLSRSGGFDHNYVLHQRSEFDEPAATVTSRRSGLKLEVLTSQPGLQFYTANQIAAPMYRRGAICLEPQGFPDAPNQPHFPSTVLEPGGTYRQFIEYRFSEFDD